jgi:hypothetical protein
MPSVPAYEAYLRYRSYQWQFTPEASRRSRECLESVGWSPSHEAMPRARSGVIPRVMGAFEPSLRRPAAWPGVLKTMNLA